MSITKKEAPAIRADTVSDEAKELIWLVKFLDYLARNNKVVDGRENADYVRNILQRFEAEASNYLRPIREQLETVRNHKAETPH